MKDKVLYNGRISCFCSKCHSKNVYYLQQKKVILPISPNGKIIQNVENNKWRTLRTIKEKFLVYNTAWNIEETECLVLVCRDCGESEEVVL